MRRTITATMLGTILVLGGMLNAAGADTWVFKDTLRPGGQDRGMTAKRADGPKCGLSHNAFRDGSPFVECMRTYGWALDHIIPDPSPPRVRSYVTRNSARDANSSGDDGVSRQRDQDNIQQMNNTQQMINNQQMLDNQQMQNDQQAQQQQQQMINDMNR